MSKIDMHVHVTPEDISGNWQKYAEKEPYFGMLSNSPKNKFACAEEIVSELDAAGFDKAVIFGFGFRDMGLCRYVNDYVIEKVKEFSSRLIGYISVVPNHRDAEKEIGRCYAAGLKGIGELFPAGQNFNIEDGKDTNAFSAACKERNLPVLIHTNEPIGHYYPGKTNTTLRQIEQFIENSQGLTIILAHWGGGFFFYEMMGELKEKCKDVYYDNAATVFLYDHRIYRTVKAMGLTGKMLFGSDFPLLSPARYMDAIDASGIPPEDRDLLLGGNAEKLLRRIGSWT